MNIGRTGLALAALTLAMVVGSGAPVHAAETLGTLRLQLDGARPIVLNLALLQAHSTESIDVSVATRR